MSQSVQDLAAERSRCTRTPQRWYATVGWVHSRANRWTTLNSANLDTAHSTRSRGGRRGIDDVAVERCPRPDYSMLYNMKKIISVTDLVRNAASIAREVETE